MLGYQDALWPNGTVPGERGCDERWALIAPELPESGVLLDIGSNLGFFSIRAVREHPDLAIVSMEADPDIADEQVRIVSANRLDRFIMLESALSAKLAEEWSETCDMVDCCILFSIVHWFDDPARVLKALSGLSRKLLVELPDAADAGACGEEKRALWGDDPEGWLLRVTSRNVRLIGRPVRHTSEVRSWLFVLDGPVERAPVRPHIGSEYDHPLGRNYSLSADAAGTRFSVRGVVRPWISGVNVANLAALGRCRYPARRVLEDLWNLAQGDAARHLDPVPHNVLWNSSGFVLIDGDDLDGGIKNPTREMRSFLRRWVSSAGYDVSGVRRIGSGRGTRFLKGIYGAVPAPVQRPIRPLVRYLRGRRRLLTRSMEKR